MKSFIIQLNSKYEPSQINSADKSFDVNSFRSNTKCKEFPRAECYEKEFPVSRFFSTCCSQIMRNGNSICPFAGTANLYTLNTRKNSSSNDNYANVRLVNIKSV